MDSIVFTQSTLSQVYYSAGEHMSKYRIYRTFEMYGFQDIEADSEEEALTHENLQSDDPHDWNIDGYGDSQLGPQLYVHSIDGKRH